AKARQWKAVREATEDLSKVADGIVAAGLALGGKPGRALDEAYENLRVAVDAAYPRTGDGDATMLEVIIERGLTPTVETDYERWEPLHWPLVVADVMRDGGFHAVIGNPPFLGGKKISGTLGGNLREWLVNVLANGATGHADLVAYFFLRASTLLRNDGTLGLIATNTVAQGDSREVGLDRMVDSGFTITRAIQSRSWPAASANLEYAAVWGTVGAVRDAVERVADDAVVRRVSSLLEPGRAVEGSPVRLKENLDVSFIGCYVLGMGFVLDPAEARAWTEANESDAEVLFPYLNGEDLNSRPDCSASRWVIDFNARSVEEAATFRLPFARVEAAVKPERLKVNRKVHRERWWQYGDKRPALRKAMASLHEVLVIALVSKTVLPVRVPTGQVFSHMLGVFATDSFADQAVLSSSLHQTWAVMYGSTLETRVRYTPSDVFETYPRPEPSAWLDAIGRTLDTDRREIMLRRQLGLTKLYNLVNDPDITESADPDVARMRAVHVELDTAVMAAYGWNDVPLDHGLHTYRQMQR
ncbi:MAG: DNA methyltransferase, partial [Dermatophilaceae bacterium]